ncbi:MAG: hypothetical protein Q7S96_00080 [bacterium]|nr:hypothetical protein [bacterium]
MQIESYGAITRTAEVNQHVELVVRVLEGANAIPNVEVRFECQAGAGLFKLGQGTTQEGVMVTDGQGYARCQVVPQEPARGRSLQLCATVYGAELDDPGVPTGRTLTQQVHFLVNVPAGEPEGCVAQAGDIVVLQQQPHHCCGGAHNHNQPPRVRFVRV